MPDFPADMTLRVDQEISIAAKPEKVFSALLELLGPLNAGPGGGSLSMKLEPWPGGRWFRDLGDNQGHLWGHVQVIKPPQLLEISGPLFMSYPAISHVQYRLTPAEGTTLLTLRHQALGQIQDDHRQGVTEGWAHQLEGIRKHAERNDRD